MNRKFRAVQFALKKSELEKAAKQDELYKALEKFDDENRELSSIHDQQKALIAGLRAKARNGSEFNPDFIQWGLQYAEDLEVRRTEAEVRIQKVNEVTQDAYRQLADASVSNRKILRKKVDTYREIVSRNQQMEQKDLEYLKPVFKLPSEV